MKLRIGGAKMSEKELKSIDYESYFFENNIKQIRSVLILSTIMYALFAWVDKVFYIDYIQVLHTIRFMYVIPFLIVSILVSFTPIFKKWHQTILLLDFLVSAIGIVYMIVIIGGNNLYTEGLILVMGVAFFMLRLKPCSAMFATMIILSTFLILSYASTSELTQFTGLNLVFLTVFSIIGLYGAFSFDSIKRKQYYYETELLGKNIVLNKEVYKQYEDLKQLHQSSIVSIAKLAETRDDYTAGHVNRVGELSKMLALKLNDDVYLKNQTDKDEFVSVITLSSSLHDIGKISISDNILNKRGPLTEAEYELMKTHTTTGFSILKEISDEIKNNVFLELGMNIARYHHEWWNGNGYPTKIKNTDIPLEARIVAVVDVYDALISERPYKSAFSKEKSIQLIKEGLGKQFDPVIGQLMIDLAVQSNDEELFGFIEK